MNKNSYPAYMIDEASGIEVSDIRHRIWVEGHKAGTEDGPALKSVIRLQNDAVMAFDNEGEQIPKYQGYYKDVKKTILKDALPETVFAHWFGSESTPEKIQNKDW